MTAAAIVLLVLVGVVASAPRFIGAVRSFRADSPDRDLARGDRLDAAVTATMVAFAAASALCAAASGPAYGVGIVVTVGAAALAAILGGGFVVRLALRAGGVTTADPAPSGTPDQASSDAGPLRGGRVIGYLERAAVAGTLLAGWPEGLAVILAVKSLARFPELRAPHASEQFIMGTFASVLWAASMSGIGYLILH